MFGVDDAAAAAIIAGTTTAAASSASAVASGKMNKKTIKYNKWALQKQREWQLQDTADQRAYQQQLYEKYQSPQAQAKQYEEAGFSKLAMLDGNGASITPVAAQQTTSAIQSAGNVGAANSAYGQQLSSAAASGASGVADAMNYYLQSEQLRAMRMKNDFDEQQYDNQRELLDSPVTPDDFPQLYGYGEEWFEKMSNRLGHEVTLRDMSNMAIFKTLVHTANKEAGHEHSNGVSGFTFEKLLNPETDEYQTGWYEDEDGSQTPVYKSAHKHGFSSDVMDELGTALLSELKEKCSSAQLTDLQAQFQQFLKDEGMWQSDSDTKKSENKLRQKQNTIDADFATYEKWETTIMGTLDDILGSMNLFKVLFNLGKKGKMPSSHNNYKSRTRQREHYDADGVMTGTTITTDSYER